jgi:hypothetical protein
MKTCSVCKVPKPFSDFHKHRQARDGYRNTCKTCRSQMKHTHVPNRICLVCKTPFYTENLEATCCSFKCGVIIRSKPRNGHILNAVCLICKTPFHTIPYKLKKGWGKYCSPQCYGMSLLKPPAMFQCLSCGVLFPCKYYESKRGRKLVSKRYASRLRRKFCSPECRETWKKNIIYDGHNTRLARLRAAPRDNYTPEEIYLRDGGICQICHKKTLIPGKCFGRAPKAPTIDHIIPVSHKDFMLIGDVRINVRLAHYQCNNQRKNKPGDAQYLLFG